MSDNVFNPGAIPVGAVDALRGPLADEGIRLPFPAPVVWWKNGDKKLKQIGGVEYYGGWAVNVEELDNLGVQPPEGWTAATWTGRENDFDVFCNRFLGFAPIVKRSKWEKTTDDQGNVKGNRSTLHVLGIAATWDKDAAQFVAYGPVVLSAKSWTAKYLTDALKEWERVSKDAREKLAGGLPANFFYAPIGTFGSEPNVQLVGKAPNQSPVTPPAVKAIENWNGATLQAMYIGADMISAAMEWKRDAQEWVDAWKSDGKKDGKNGNGALPEPDGMDIPF